MKSLTRVALATFFASLILNFATAASAVAKAPVQTLIDWVDAEIETQRRRLGLVEKSARDRGIFDDPGQVTAGSEVLRNQKQEVEFHRTRIKDLERLRSQLAEQKARDATAETSTLASEISRLSPSCQLGDCLKILGAMNADLAADIADITNQIVVTNWDSFQIEKRSSGSGSEARDDELAEVALLTLRKWACERSVATFSGNIKMHHSKMARCLSSVLSEEATALGKKPSVGISRWSYSAPVDRNLSMLPKTRERMTKKIEEFSDFSATPWDVFRLCAYEANGELAEALDLCYEVLRANRARPNFTRKLLDIRGDRYSGGDNSGDWYHFFGMARLGVSLGNAAYLGYAYAELVDRAEFSEHNDFAEIGNDLRGARIGNRMRENLAPIGAVSTVRSVAKPIGSAQEECKFEEIFDHRSEAQAGSAVQPTDSALTK